MKLLEKKELCKESFDELKREVAIGLEEAERGELIDADVVFNQLYEKLAKRRLETVKEIEQGLADVKEGRTVSLEEFEARMRRKYNISS